MDIGKRITIGLVFLIILNLLVGGFAIVRMIRVDSQMKDIVQNWALGAADLSAVQAALNRSQILLLIEGMAQDPAERRRIDDACGVAIDSARRQLQAYDDKGEVDDAHGERPLYARTVAAYGAYETSAGELRALLLAGEKRKADAFYFDQTFPRIEESNRAFDDEVRFNVDHLKESGKRGVSLVHYGKIGLVVGLGIALLLGIVAAVFVIRSTALALAPIVGIPRFSSREGKDRKGGAWLPRK